MPTIQPAPGTAEYAYQIEHYSDNIQPQSYAGIAICGIFATALVVIRLMSQLIHKKQLFIDDWLIIIAWGFAMSLVGEAAVSLYNGMGLHQLRVIQENPNPPYAIVQAFEAGYFVSVVWATDMMFIKLSLLFYYRRLFLVQQKWLSIALWANIIYAFGLGMGASFEFVFQCWPVPYFWERFSILYGVDPGYTGTCLPQNVHLATPAILSTISDVAIITLPLTVLWGLQIQTRQKVSLMLVFALGIFVIGVGIARIIFIFQVSNETDTTWNDVETIEWSVVETSVGIIVACFPVAAPLWGSLLRRMGLASMSTEHSANITGASRKRGPRGGVKRLDSQESSSRTLKQAEATELEQGVEWSHQTVIAGNNGFSNEPMPLNAIGLRHEVDVRSSAV